MSNPPSVTAQIAEFCLEASTAGIDETTFAQAVRAFIDTIGVGVAGAHEPVVTAMQTSLCMANGSGRATSLSTGEQVNPHHAASINATAGHAMDFDDHLSDVNGHPSVVLVPPILAMAEELDLTGEQMLRAYVIGHQVMCAVSAGLPVRAHWTKGWHATETVGVLGAAAAVGSLLRLTAAETRNALGIAASMAAGSRQNCGFSVKPIHAGMAAGNGLLAARLAASGVDADPRQLEGPLGYFAVFGVDSDLTAIAPVLEERWTLTTRGLNVKAFPACYAVHPAGEAASELRMSGLDPRTISKVVVTVQPTGLTGPIHHDPITVDQARFSMEYAVATALVRGQLDITSFTEATLADASVRRLMAMMSLKESAVPPVGAREFEGWFATVEVTSEDGRVQTARRNMPHGEAHDPLTELEIDNKFLACLDTPGAVFDGPTLLACLRSLPTTRSVSNLFDSARSRV